MENNSENVLNIIKKFTEWLDQYGEYSYDHQSYFSSRMGNMAKKIYYERPYLGIFLVAPMVLSEAFLPRGRALFSKKQRIPIGDAHYAMGYSYMFRITGDEAYRKRSIDFLDALMKSSCAGYHGLGWGYPFDWQTRPGKIRKGTPLITTTPYVFEAFKEAYLVDGDEKWLEILRSIAEHCYQDYKDYPVGNQASTCSYTPYDGGGVINASAYRGWLLTSAHHLFSEDKYKERAEMNLRFVVQNQDESGLWPYSIEGARDFIDHYHTCFVIKALIKTDMLNGQENYSDVIKKGLGYYLDNLFDDNGLPKPYSRPPRLTVYKKELYDYAECINLCVLAGKKYPDMSACLEKVVKDLLSRWIKKDGSFRSRELLFGWDNVPMHRWAQSQTFRALSFMLASQKTSVRDFI